MDRDGEMASRFCDPLTNIFSFPTNGGLSRHSVRRTITNLSRYISTTTYGCATPRFGQAGGAQNAARVRVSI